MRRSLIIGVITLVTLTGCGGGMGGSDFTFPPGKEEALMTCASVFALDQIIQGGGENITREQIDTMLTEIPANAQKAATADDQYRQLELLVGTFIDAIKAGDQKAVLDLVAVEGECDQLGMGM